MAARNICEFKKINIIERYENFLYFKAKKSVNKLDVILTGATLSQLILPLLDYFLNF